MNDHDSMTPPGSHPSSIFLEACRSQLSAPIPVWFPVTRPGKQYPARGQQSIPPLPDLFQSPDAIRKSTLDSVSLLNPDAVLLASDGMLPLQGMGVRLQDDRGMQFQAASPLRSPRDIDLLGTPPAEEHLSPTLSAIPPLQQACHTRGFPLVGWARAPLSLALDAIDGPRSAHSENTRTLLYHHPAAWKRLMEKLVTVTADYVQHQVRAGVQAVLIDDPVSGSMLPPADYRRHIFPYLAQLLDRLRNLEIPVLYHSALQQPLLGEVAGLADVISLEYRIPRESALQALDPNQALQITLDPLLFSAPWREVKVHLDAFLDAAAGRSGTLLGVFDPGTDNVNRRNLRRTVEYIHHQTRLEVRPPRSPVKETRGGKR